MTPNLCAVAEVPKGRLNLARSLQGREEFFPLVESHKGRLNTQRFPSTALMGLCSSCVADRR